MTSLKDALYNLHKDSGSGVSYAKGLMVGAVSALMHEGKSFDEALGLIYRNLPKGFRRECFPDGWLYYVVVVHVPTGRQFYLGRDYRLIGEINQQPHSGIPTEGSIEDWPEYPTTQQPAWAEGHPSSEFHAYWLY